MPYTNMAVKTVWYRTEGDKEKEKISSLKDILRVNYELVYFMKYFCDDRRKHCLESRRPMVFLRWLT